MGLRQGDPLTRVSGRKTAIAPAILLTLLLAGCDLFTSSTVSVCGCVVAKPLMGNWTLRAGGASPTGKSEVVEFHADGVYLKSRQYVDSAHRQNDSYQEKGTWRSDGDSLYLAYRIEWKDSAGVVVPQQPQTTYKEVLRFRVNDSGWLATTVERSEPSNIIPDWSSSPWTYYLPMDGDRHSRTYPAGNFTAQAWTDTVFGALDTVRLQAWPWNPTQIPSRYLWSFDGGKTYSDTSKTGEFRKIWSAAAIGLNVVAVKGVDAAGHASPPYYFEVRIRDQKESP